MHISRNWRLAAGLARISQEIVRWTVGQMNTRQSRVLLQTFTKRRTLSPDSVDGPGTVHQPDTVQVYAFGTWKTDIITVTSTPVPKTNWLTRDYYCPADTANYILAFYLVLPGRVERSTPVEFATKQTPYCMRHHSQDCKPRTRKLAPVYRRSIRGLGCSLHAENQRAVEWWKDKPQRKTSGLRMALDRCKQDQPGYEASI